MRRSFSLLELMIALAVLLAMGGLVMPALLNSMRARSFEHAADLVAHQLLLARVHAQRSGKPVEVLWVRERGWIEARYFSLTTDDNDSSERGEVADTDMNTDADADAEIREPWASRILPSGVKVSYQPPDNFDEGGDAGDEVEVVVGADADVEEEEKIRLVVFWPDGSAWPAESLWLKDDGEWAVRVVINPWTGEVMGEKLSGEEDSDEEESGEIEGMQ